MMAAHNPRRRMGAHLLLSLGLVFACSIVGCREGDSKPKPTDAAQGEKMQKYMSSYADQIKAANKAKGKGKTEAKPAEKPAPK
jgi:hypothetical protein